MIKKTKNTKQQLLRKDSDSSSQTPPFEMEDYYSAVGNQDRDSADHELSYYCLEKELTNPYFVEMTNRTKEDEKPIRMNTDTSGDRRKMNDFPQKVTMNGNCYLKISDSQKQVAQEKKAQCGACRTLQMIPKNATKFICFNCRTICQCTSPKDLPKPETPRSNSSVPTRNMKLFRCGVCSVKVQYEAGLSQYIKCSRCNTVNMVSK